MNEPLCSIDVREESHPDDPATAVVPSVTVDTVDAASKTVQSPSPLSKVRRRILDHYGDTRPLYLVHRHPDDLKSLPPPGDRTSNRQPRRVCDCALCVRHFLDVLRRRESLAVPSQH